MKYKAIIFDIDGTVVDTIAMNFVPLQQLIKEILGKDVSYTSLLKYVTYPGIKIMEELGFDDIDKQYPLWVERVNEYPEGCKPYDDIENLFEEINKLGLKQAAVSSKKHAQYIKDIVDKGLDKYFETAVLEEDTNNHKPDPEPLLECVSRLGLNTEEVIYIGDGYSDYQCCLNAGIDFGYALWGSVETREISATITLEKPLDLLTYLK